MKEKNEKNPPRCCHGSSCCVSAFTAFVQDFEINKYENLQVAKAQKAIELGWVPAIIPASAYEIAETHDPETHTLYGKFKYKEADEATLLSNLTELHDQNNTMSWEGFLFRIDREKNLVRYRNKTAK